jgi:hypothetical protein
MQHACRKRNAMLQRAKIRRLRHTPAIIARHVRLGLRPAVAMGKKPPRSRDQCGFAQRSLRHEEEPGGRCRRY